MLMFILAETKQTNAQAYFSIGYNVGRFTSGLPNLKNEVYHFNTVDFKNWGNDFKFVNIPHGLNLEIGVRFEKFYYFVQWSNKHIIMHGNGPNPKNSSEEMDYDFKVRLNQFSFCNFGYQITPKFGVGINAIDLGLFKFLYKTNVAQNSTAEVNKWNDYYAVNTGALSSYSTSCSGLFIDYDVVKFLHLRLAYDIDLFGVNLGFTPNHRYRANNLTLNISIRFNKN